MAGGAPDDGMLKHHDDEAEGRADRQERGLLCLQRPVQLPRGSGQNGTVTAYMAA